MRVDAYRFVLVVVAAAFTLMLAEVTHAFVLGSLLRHGANSLVDSSRSHNWDDNGDGILNHGDLIFGVLEFEAVNGTGDPSPGAIFAVYAGVENIAPGDTYFGKQIIRITPVPAANSHSLQKLIDPSVIPGLGAVAQSAWDNALFAIFETPNSNMSGNPFASQWNAPPDGPLTPEQIIGQTITAANGYRLDMIVGLETDQDFFTMLLENSAVIMADQFYGNGDGLLQYSEIQSTALGAQGVGSFTDRAGLSILYEEIAELVGWNEVVVSDYVMPPATTSHDIVALPEGQISIARDSSVPIWNYVNDTHFQFDARLVPEPASLALLGGGLGAILGLVVFHRRKQAQPDIGMRLA